MLHILVCYSGRRSRIHLAANKSSNISKFFTVEAIRPLGMQMVFMVRRAVFVRSFSIRMKRRATVSRGHRHIPEMRRRRTVPKRNGNRERVKLLLSIRRRRRAFMQRAISRFFSSPKRPEWSAVMSWVRPVPTTLSSNFFQETRASTPFLNDDEAQGKSQIRETRRQKEPNHSATYHSHICNRKCAERCENYRNGTPCWTIKGKAEIRSKTGSCMHHAVKKDYYEQ